MQPPGFWSHGSGLDIDELPVPRLVIVTIDENAPPDFETMRTEITRAIPAATFDDHRTWVDRLVSMARTTVLVGTGVLSLVIAATVLTVILQRVERCPATGTSSRCCISSARNRNS